MCLGPELLIGASLAAGGAGLSAFGQAKNNKGAKKNAMAEAWGNTQQRQQDLAEMQLRNRIAREYMGRQQGYADQNRVEFNTALGGMGAAAQGKDYDQAVSARKTFAEGLFAPTQLPELGAADGLTRATYDARYAKAGEDSRAHAARAAELSAYGDVQGKTARATADLGRKIDTTNNFARGDAALLGADQDLQAFQIRRPIRVPSYNTNGGDWMKALGGAMGQMGGSMMGGFNPMSLGSQFASWFGGGTTSPTAKFGFAHPTQRA